MSPQKKSPKHEEPTGFLKRIIANIRNSLPTKKQFAYLPNVLSSTERYVVLALLIVLVGSLAYVPFAIYTHVTYPVPAFGGSFKEGIVGTPNHINPLLFQNSDVDRDITSLIYPGLMKISGGGKLDYDLANSYSVSSDGLTYTFILRDKLVWQDGQPVTPDDVIFTVLTAQNGDYGSFQKSSWQNIDVSKKDERTVTFTLKNRYAQFMNNMTMGILPKHIWENVKSGDFATSDYNLKPIGAGPYKFSKIKKDANGKILSYEVSAFADYYAGKPFISTIAFLFYATDQDMLDAYNNGDIDNISYVSPQKLTSLRFPGRLTLNELKIPRYFGIFFNQDQNKLLADKNVRLALSYATDKQKIVQNVLLNRGSVIDSPMLPGILDIPASNVSYGFNQDLAKKTLENDKWVTPIGSSSTTRQKSITDNKAKSSNKDATPTQLTIELTTSNFPDLVAVANQIKDQWASVGVSIKLRILSITELQQVIKNRSYEALLFGEVLPLDPDPFSFWHSSQSHDNGLNLALYNNPAADKLLEQGRQTLDSNDRKSIYAQFQDIVINDVPGVFLYSSSYIYGQASKIHNGINTTIGVPSNRFAGISTWYINTSRSFTKPKD